MRLLNAVFILIFATSTYAFAQNTNTDSPKVWRVSEAYVVLVKERAKSRGDLYEAKQLFVPQTPKVESAELRLALLNREIKKLSRINARNAIKFSAAYGDLLLTKIQYEVELYELRQRFTPEYIAVKKKEVQLASINGDLKQISKSFR